MHYSSFKFLVDTNDWMFVFIGPILKHDNSIYAKLDKKENILFLGRKPLEQRYNYICNFNVGVLCAQMIEMELLGSQLKIWEYISAGIPIVSIPIEEYKQFGGMVLTANNLKEWESKIEKALQINNTAKIQERLIFAEWNSWDKRVSTISELIEHTLKNKT